MRKLFLGILIFSLMAGATPALAKMSPNSFLAAVAKLVQEIMPSEEILVEPEEPMDEEFVDPREVQQVLKEIKDMRRELNRFAKQFKKLPNSGDDLNQINTLLEQLAGFESNINQGVDLRDNIQEFRDAQIWEQVNIFRAKIEIPKETAQWNKEIKKLEKMLVQKKYQNLGLDLGGAKSKVEEIKAGLARVQESYNSGDLETAMAEFDDLRQDFHPGEMFSVIQRMWDVMSKLKMVKDAEVRNQIRGALDEVVTNFNEGEYRIARELMDENFNEIMTLISKAYSVGKKKGVSKEGLFRMTEQLEGKLKEQAEEKRVNIQEMREGGGGIPQPMPQPMQQPTPKGEGQSMPSTQQLSPVQPQSPVPTPGGGGEVVSPPIQPVAPQPTP